MRVKFTTEPYKTADKIMTAIVRATKDRDKDEELDILNLIVRALKARIVERQ